MTQDEERRRLGRGLHDTVGQYLAAVKMSLDGLASQEWFDERETRKQIIDCLPHLDRATREVRTLSYFLYPPMLEETGLSSAIRWHMDGFSKRSDIRVTHEIADDVRLARDVELALFRVFQESLTNVHRHSQSETVHIKCGIEDGKAVLEVKDKGKGMSSLSAGGNANSLGTLGVGIRGMHERIRQLGGKLEITSSSEGTIVRAAIPVNAGSDADSA
jgi:two-component system, NarL family, sensor kinase